MDNPFSKFNKFLKSIRSTDTTPKTVTLSCGCVYETETDQKEEEVKLTKNIKLCPKHQAEKISKLTDKDTIIHHRRPEKL
jgi:hypothetical protein